jgi:glycosyltransferase involved in cell wall biosynthesis
MLSMRGERPELCLVHGLGTAILFSWLRRVLPVEVPVAMYYHGGEVPGVARWSDEETRAAFAAMDVVFTNTEFSAAGAVERGCPREKLVILPVGFALEDFQPPARREYRPQGTLRLLSAGRMSEEKGFIYALGAVKRLVDQGIRDISYSLTGEGYLRAPLEQFVKSSGLEPYVHFLGTLSTDGVLRAMQESDVLVLPSIQVGEWVENQACAVQEALLAKAVVVTTRTGGVPESIPAEMERFSVPPKDDEALARAIAEVHALPVRELAGLGDAGREFVLHNYEIGSLNARMLDVMLAASPHSLRAPARDASYSPQPASPCPDGLSNV